MDSLLFDSDRWFKAAAAGDLLTLRLMIVQGADLDLRDGVGRTALNLASQNQQTDAMTTLLAAKQLRYMQARDPSFSAGGGDLGASANVPRALVRHA